MRSVPRVLAALCALALVAALCGSQALAQQSPSVSKIAFARDGQVLVMNPDGSGVVALAGGGDQGNCYGPCWSPDGLGIAFSSTRTGTSGSDLFAMSPDGSNQVQLTNHPDTNDEWSEWSPLGDAIAFEAYDLYVLDLPTLLERRAVPEGQRHSDASPAWSPDSNTIAFWRGGSSNIYVVPAAGGTPTLTVQNGGPVDWSPVGGMLTYRYSVPACNIWVVPVDGCGTPTDAAVNLTNHGTECYDDQPTWSPDGQWIAFERRARTGKKDTYGPYHIMKMRADGSGLQDLGLGRNPEWSPWLDTVPPTAVAGGPYSGEVNEPVQFDASESTDADGSVVRYVWDFGDGSPRIEGATPSHAYTGPGTYPVRLIVVDDDRVPDMDLTSATISGNYSPVADAGPDVQADVGVEVPFDGSGSCDPDGQIVSWQWDFGDGSPPAYGPVVSHAYTAAGSYDVGLIVVDNEGASDVDVAVANITEPALPMHVKSIAMSVEKVSGKWRATSVVTIVDAGDVPVTGATVYGDWSGAYSASVSGSTNPSGQVTFTSSLVKGNALTFTFAVTGVVKTGYIHVPGVSDTNSITTP